MSRADRREHWVVLSNCQSLGLANAIAAVGRGISCDACDVWQMAGLLAENPDHFRRYDRALILPEARPFPGFPSDDALPPAVDVPSFIFGGYHPDCCYVSADGQLILDDLIGPYHSMIALAAFKEGIGAAGAARWFTGPVYERAGYYRQWGAQRERLIALFAGHGFNIRGVFRRAGRGRSFMHTIDHPTMGMLIEIARVILRTLDRPVDEQAAAPADQLAVTSWPIYPEVGEQYGVAGSYRFRPANRYESIDLDEYLEKAFAEFDRWDRSLLRVASDIQPRLQLVRQIIREGL